MNSFQNNIRPEFELLLQCARDYIVQQDAGSDNLRGHKDIDWDYLFDASLWHRVMPLLFHGLHKYRSGVIPQNTLDKLKNLYMGNTVRNIFLAKELLRILGHYKMHKIDAVPFKGPVLAEYLFGDVALRQFEDLDILISEDNVIEACDLLRSDGYRFIVKLDRRCIHSYIKAEDSITLVNPDSNAIVDIHWRMRGRDSHYSFALSDLKDRLEYVNLSGEKVLHIPPEELLIYLCLHGAKTQWDVLDLICCIAGLIASRPEMEWNIVMIKGKAMRCERILALGLMLVQHIFNIALPEKIELLVKTSFSNEKIALKVQDNLFGEEKNGFDRFKRYQDLYFNLRLKDSIPDTVRYCIQLAVRPGVKDLMTFPLPVSLSFLYYFLRPIRISKELCAAIFRNK